MRTQGISPKAVLAAVLPTLGGLVAVAVQWIATGQLDRAELATAVGAVVASLLAFAGAYAGKPGAVTLPPTSVTVDGPTVARAAGERGLSLLEALVVLLLVAVIYLAAGAPGL